MHQHDALSAVASLLQHRLDRAHIRTLANRIHTGVVRRRCARQEVTDGRAVQALLVAHHRGHHLHLVDRGKNGAAHTFIRGWTLQPVRP
jgi:hypothetical protein